MVAADDTDDDDDGDVFETIEFVSEEEVEAAHEGLANAGNHLLEATAAAALVPASADLLQQAHSVVSYISLVITASDSIPDATVADIRALSDGIRCAAADGPCPPPPGGAIHVGGTRTHTHARARAMWQLARTGPSSQSVLVVQLAQALADAYEQQHLDDNGSSSAVGALQRDVAAGVADLLNVRTDDVDSPSKSDEVFFWGGDKGQGASCSRWTTARTHTARAPHGPTACDQGQGRHAALGHAAPRGRHSSCRPHGYVHAEDAWAPWEWTVAVDGRRAFGAHGARRPPTIAITLPLHLQ